MPKILLFWKKNGKPVNYELKFWGIAQLAYSYNIKIQPIKKGRIDILSRNFLLLDIDGDKDDINRFIHD